MGSPPPEGSKNEVFRFRSVNNIVIAPANTGRERRRRIAVMRMDQTMRGILSIETFLWCILIIVEIKLIAPMIDEAPAICKEKMVMSTAGPLWYNLEDRGGYTVHPVPDPKFISLLRINNKRDGGKSQNLILFIRG